MQVTEKSMMKLVSSCVGTGHTKWDLKWHEGHKDVRNCPIAHPLSVLPNHEDFPIMHNVIRNFFSRYLPRVALPAEAPRAQCENLDRCYGKGNSLSFENWQQGHVKKTACPISKSIKKPVPVEFVDIVSRDLQMMGVPFPKCPNQGCEGRGHTKYACWNQGHVRQKDCPKANPRVFLPDPEKYPDAFRELQDVCQTEIEMVQLPDIKRLGLDVPRNLENERHVSLYRQFAELIGTDSDARPSKRRRQNDKMMGWMKYQIFEKMQVWNFPMKIKNLLSVDVWVEKEQLKLLED